MADNGNDIDIKVGVDGSGVEVGLRQVETAVGRTARTVENLGKSDGFNRLGDGAAGAGQKIDRTTKGFADSIQRATAAMQSGTKGSAEYYAALANSRGVNVNALKPYLDQLNAVTQQTKMAADAQRKLEDGEKFVAALRQRAAEIGKTSAELAAMRAAQLGVSDSAGPLIEQLRAAEEATGGFSGALGVSKEALVAFAAGLVGAVSIGTFVAGVQQSIDVLADLDDMAQKTGSSVESLSRLQKVAAATGQDFGVVDDAIVKLARGMGGLDEDSNKVLSALKRLGVSSKDAAGNLRAPSDVLVDASRNLQKYADGATKTAAANDLIKGSGAALLPFLNDVAENVDKFSGASTASAIAASAFKDNLGLLKVRVSELGMTVAENVLPSLLKLSEYVKELADSGKFKQWIDNTGSAVGRFAEFVERAYAVLVPAAKVAAAYFAIFVGAPAVITAVSGAMALLYGGIGKMVVGMMAGSGASLTLTSSLYGTSVAAQVASGSLSKLALAGNVLFAAFAGFQLGTYLESEFAIARVAGAVLVSSLVKGVENVKFAFEFMSEGISFVWDKTISSLKGAFASYLDVVAGGLKFVGATETAATIQQYSESLRSAGAAQKTFAERTAGISAAHTAAIKAINDDVEAQIDYELSTKKVTKTAAGAAAAVNGKTVAVARSGEAAAKAAKEFDELVAKINGKDLGQDADFQKNVAKLEAGLRAGKISLADYITTMEAYIGQQASSIAIVREREKGEESLAKVIAKAAAENQKEVGAIYEQARALEFKVKTYDLLPAAITMVRIAELEASKQSTVLTDLGVADIQRKIDALKVLAKVQSDSTIQDEAKKANEVMAADWSKTVEKYEDVFRTGFADMLNNGKDGWKSFTKSLVTTFKTSVADQLYKMFLQPFVMKIAASFAGGGGFGGIGGGAQGGIGSYLQMGQSLYSGFSGAFTSGISGLATNFGNLVGSQAISSFGTGLSLTTGQAATAAKAYATAGNTTVASGLTSGAGAASYIPIAGWIAAGMTVANNLYKQGWDPNNGSVSRGMIFTEPLTGTSTILNKLFQGLGMSDKNANLFSGASITSKLFGRKNPEVENYGIEGSFGASGFDGNAYQNILQRGGVFRSDKRYQIDSALDAGTESTFDDTIKNLMLAVKGFGAQMGIEATQIESYTKSIQLSLTADDAKNQELIAGVFGGIGDDLAKLLIPKIAELSEKGETAAAALQRVATGYGLIDAAMESIGRSFGAVGISSLDARERLIELSGGLETFGKGAAYFAQNYLSEAERLAPITASVDAALAGLGLSSVTTRDQFKDVVLGLDLTTESGATTYSGLMKIQEAFALLHPIIDTTTEAINAATDAARNERAALQEQLDGLTLSPETLAGKARNASLNLDLYDQVQTAAATKAAVEGVNAANRVYIDQIREIERSYLTQAELRSLDIVGMDASTVAWYDLLQARKAEKLANEEAKDAALSAAQAIKDAATAQRGAVIEDMNKRLGGGTAAKIAEDIAGDRARLEGRLFDLTGSASDRLARARQTELDATNDLLDPILRLIFAQEDLASAAEAAARATEVLKASAGTAFDIVSSSVNAEKLGAKAGLDGRVAILNAQKSAAASEFSAKAAFAQAVAASVEKSNQALSQFAGSVRSTLDGLRLDQNSAGDRFGAQKQIADALEAAKSGKLPTDGSLSGALSIASQKDTSGFSSYVDFARDFGVTAGKIADLSAIADTQLSASDQALAFARASAEGIAQQAQISAEGFDEQIKKAQEEYDRQISNFDTTIQVARDQLDAALGTKLEVMSLKDAIVNFATSVDALKPAAVAPVVAPLPQAYLASQAPQAGNAELAAALNAMAIELAQIKASSARAADSGATTAGVLASNRPILVEVSQ